MSVKPRFWLFNEFSWLVKEVREESPVVIPPFILSRDTEPYPLLSLFSIHEGSVGEDNELYGEGLLIAMSSLGASLVSITVEFSTLALACVQIALPGAGVVFSNLSSNVTDTS